ncbi:EamA family transporter RarD [Altericroceibacterium spongiae]|uniref:EamA family transporter RarD n=1 Tax=Altericroceibacterium spongiae TaxID=2320269 RepID=A0A420EJV7_9SPHN|nr:EamA family transporter RarD [Altericroceibacterium spongiae]RKF21001.1 EamA family transporter RarD [Altericroceibacterium spongiae]
MNAESAPLDRTALSSALLAHAFWGTMPLYLMLVRSVPPVEFVAWRVVMSLPFCFAIVWARGMMPEFRAILRNRKTVLTLVATSLAIGINWASYVWAIQTDHVYAASIGYYILPLVMMVLAHFVLGEHLTKRQWIAAGLAGLGVAALIGGALSNLWVSLALASTFAFYGLMRKTVAAGAMVGLALETLLLLPIAAGVLIWYSMTGPGISFGKEWGTSAAIMLSAPMTALPLLFFAIAARRLPYSLMGFLQFLSPSIIFLLGLIIFGEKLAANQLVSFVLIWTAAALFLREMLRRRPKPSKAAGKA